MPYLPIVAAWRATPKAAIQNAGERIRLERGAGASGSAMGRHHAMRNDKAALVILLPRENFRCETSATRRTMLSIWRRSARAVFRRLPAVRPYLSLAILLRFQILLGAVFFLFPFFARRAPGDALFGNLFVLGWVGQATITLSALVASWVFLVTTALVVWHGGARIDQPCELPFASILRHPLFRARMLVALALAAPNLAAVFIASGEGLAGGGLSEHLLDLGRRTGALVAGLLAAVVVFYLSGLLEAWLTPPERPRSGLFPELPAWISRLHSLRPPRSPRRALVLLRALLRSPGFGPGYLDADREIGRGHALAV